MVSVTLPVCHLPGFNVMADELDFTCRNHALMSSIWSKSIIIFGTLWTPYICTCSWLASTSCSHNTESPLMIKWLLTYGQDYQRDYVWFPAVQIQMLNKSNLGENVLWSIRNILWLNSNSSKGGSSGSSICTCRFIMTQREREGRRWGGGGGLMCSLRGRFGSLQFWRWYM